MADTKLTALSEISVPSLEDLFYTVDDPSGTPISNKLSANRFLGHFNNLCQGRLGLVSGSSMYVPASATPNSTSTAADTISFATAHGWVTGTIVTPSATIGGLTAGTKYWLNVINSTTVSFHTTFAAAKAGTSLVDLTATITAEIQPSGLEWDSLYWNPINGGLLNLFDGTREILYRVTSPIVLVLSSLATDTIYDAFLYNNSGTITLEFSAAWTSSGAGTSSRADALTLQNGSYVKSGAPTRRWVGTIRTVSATTIEDTGERELLTDNVRARRFIWNKYNQMEIPLCYTGSSASHTYTSTTVRAWNADNDHRIEFVCGEPTNILAGAADSTLFQTTSGNVQVALGLNRTTANDASQSINGNLVTVSLISALDILSIPSIGYNFLQLVQNVGAGTGNYFRPWITGRWRC